MQFLSSAKFVWQFALVKQNFGAIRSGFQRDIVGGSKHMMKTTRFDANPLLVLYHSRRDCSVGAEIAAEWNASTSRILVEITIKIVPKQTCRVINV